MKTYTAVLATTKANGGLGLHSHGLKWALVLYVSQPALNYIAARQAGRR